MKQIRFIYNYILHFLTARNTKGYGVHSPFLFQLVRFVIYDKSPYYIFPEIEKLRQNLKKDKRILHVEDFGTSKSRGRKLSEICTHSLKQAKYAQLLYRIVNFNKAQNVTELGTVYSVEEIRELAELAHNHGIFLHMDGARISNAAISLDLPFKTFTIDAGVDILSFGGTKNGMMIGEAVLFFNPALSIYSKYFRKQAAQLYSKMRFVGAQFVPYLRDEIWKTNAMHSNKMAKLLETEIRKIKGVEITQLVEANGVFALIPKTIIPKLQREYFFYTWNESRGEVRWMTAFDTTEEDILNFTKLLRELMTE